MINRGRKLSDRFVNEYIKKRNFVILLRFESKLDIIVARVEIVEKQLASIYIFKHAKRVIKITSVEKWLFSAKTIDPIFLVVTHEKVS